MGGHKELDDILGIQGNPSFSAPNFNSLAQPMINNNSDLVVVGKISMRIDIDLPILRYCYGGGKAAMFSSAFHGNIAL
jgi:hypothetical protein